MMRKILLYILFSVSYCAVNAQEQTDTLTERYASTIAKAMAYLQRDSLSHAESLMLKAMDIKPAELGNAILLRYIGEIRVQQNRCQEAMQAFTLGIGLSPRNIDLLLDRSSLYLQMGNEDEALADLDDLLLLDADNIQALFYRAYIYGLQHNATKARIDYEHLLTLNPRHKQARMGLALLCDDNNRPREAMEHIDVLMRYWPEDATILALRAGMYQKRRAYDMAMRDFNHAIRLQPTQPDLYISRGLLYKETKHPCQAENDFRKAVDLGASPLECTALLSGVKKKK